MIRLANCYRDTAAALVGTLTGSGSGAVRGDPTRTFIPRRRCWRWVAGACCEEVGPAGGDSGSEEAKGVEVGTERGPEPGGAPLRVPRHI